MQRELLFFCLGAALLGCGSSDDSAGSGVSLDGLIHATVVDEHTKVVSGAKVCVVDRPEIPCVTSDELGIADLKVPKNAELVVSMEKQEHLAKRFQLLAEESYETGLHAFGFQRTAWFDSLAKQLGGSLELTEGLVALQGPVMEGVKFELDPLPQQAAGPWQLMFEGGVLELCTPAATSCELGLSGWSGLPPGTYRATVTAPGMTCTPNAFACKDGSPACMEVVVVPGALTHAKMPCQ